MNSYDSEEQEIIILAGDVLTNGIRIHYYRTDDGQARPWPAIVLLHGITDTGLCWPRVVKALSPEYDLILPDARGHGLSDKPAAGYTPQDHAADVAGLIQALGLKRPVLLGHSMGGGVAATFAGLYPDLVGGVILEDPPWREPAPGDSPAQRDAAIAQWRREILAQKERTAEDIIAAGKAERPKWADEEFPDWAVAKQQVSPDVVGYAAEWLVPWQDVVRRIACPALLITADPKEGAIVTPEVAAEAATLMPKGKVVYIPGAGHNIRREQFEAYMAAVREFLGELG
jgi:pimeloyl-ACP methyl ester carboxylesterase